MIMGYDSKMRGATMSLMNYDMSACENAELLSKSGHGRVGIDYVY